MISFISNIAWFSEGYFYIPFFLKKNLVVSIKLLILLNKQKIYL